MFYQVTVVALDHGQETETGLVLATSHGLLAKTFKRNKKEQVADKRTGGKDFASTGRAAENRTRWKGILAKSSVVPRQRPWGEMKNGIYCHAYADISTNSIELFLGSFLSNISFYIHFYWLPWKPKCKTRKMP